MSDETPSPFKTIAEANAAGIYCGTLANGDTFGDEDDAALDLEGRRVSQRDLALAAASQAAEAAAELLRFAREGAAGALPFGEAEVIEKLADALKLAIETEHHADPDSVAADEDRNQLYGAVSKFLDGWAG